MNAIVTAQYGLLAASRQFEASATKIATQGQADAGDLVEGVVGLTQAKTAFKANAQVIKIADEMWDSLLSIQSDKR